MKMNEEIEKTAMLISALDLQREFLDAKFETVKAELRLQKEKLVELINRKTVAEWKEEIAKMH